MLFPFPPNSDEEVSNTTQAAPSESSFPHGEDSAIASDFNPLEDYLNNGDMNLVI